MSLLTTGRQLSKTWQNAARLKTITGVFAKHGFAELLRKAGLQKVATDLIWKESSEFEQLSVPERVRLCFEELGPTFVKLGQLLASRPDLVPDEFVREFSKLHDRVQKLPFSEMSQVLEKEWGPDWRNKFASIDEEPLGSASIAQAHRAQLTDGTSVVLKIQRPGLGPIIREDLNVLYFLAELLEKYLPESRPFDPTGIVDEYFKTLNLEVNFIVEANNIRRFTQNFKNSTQIHIPQVYLDMSTEKVLVLEALEGWPLSSDQALTLSQSDPHEIMTMGLRAYLKMVFRDGLFHGDLHAGNLFLLPDGALGVIDFGVVGRLNTRTQSSIASMLVALAKEDYERLAYEYVDLAPFHEDIDVDRLARDLRNLIAPFYGLTSRNVNLGQILLQSSALAARYKISMPTELMLFFKSLVAVEGLGRKLKHDFDFLNLGLEFAQELVKAPLESGRALDEVNRIARESRHLLQGLPRQVHFFLKRINSPDSRLKLSIQEWSDMRKAVEGNGTLMFLGLVMGSLILSASLIVSQNPTAPLPPLALIGYSLATVLGLFAFFNFLRK